MRRSFTLLVAAAICAVGRAQPASATPGVPWAPVGRLATHAASEIASSPWSIGCETLDRNYADYEAYKAYVGPLGAKKARVQTGWGKTEPQRGVYRFEWLDRVVDDLRAQGVQPWLELNYGNPIYPGGGGTEIGAGGPTSPEALAAWDRWVKVIVDRYRDRITEWEIWNEPDGGKPAVSATNYRGLYERTGRIVRAEEPAAKLDAFALAGHLAYAEEVLKGLEADGALDLVDAITVHAYPFNPDDVTMVEKARKLVAQFPRPIAVIMGETGAPSAPTSGALRGHTWTETIQAKWDLRRLLAHRAIDAPMSLFTLSEFSYPKRGLNTKGLLQTNPDLTIKRPKPAYFAAQAVFTLFDGATSRRPDFSYTVDSGKGWAASAYDRAGGNMVAIWNGSESPVDANSLVFVQARFKGIAFAHPVWVDLRTGLVSPVPAEACHQDGGDTVIAGLPLYDSPILIADAAVIPLAK